MSSPAAVAQHALDEAQTAALVGEDHEMLRILLSALHHIASGGRRDAERWAGLRKEWDDVLSIVSGLPGLPKSPPDDDRNAYKAS